MLFLSILISCSPSDPRFEKERVALEAYREFEKARVGEDWETAEQALANAIRSMPDSRNLQSWLVFLQLEKGDHESCIEMGKSRLALYPGEGQLRYTVASCLAQQDRFTEAAAHLALLVQDGRYHPYDIGEDPNFSSMLGMKDYGHLVQRPELNVGIVDSVSSVLVGQESGFRIQVRFRSSSQLKLQAPVSTDYQIIKLSEKYSDLDDFMSMCQIDVQFKALKAGLHSVSGWLISDGNQSSELETYEFEAVSINELSQVSHQPLQPVLPSEVLRLEMLPFVHQKDDGLLIVAAPPNAQIKYPANQSIDLELWKSKTMQAKGRLFKKGIEKMPLSVEYSGEVLLEGHF